jgi:hypothetical protein
MKSEAEIRRSSPAPRLWPRGVVIRSAAEAASALRVATELGLDGLLPLLSLPGAGLWLGPGLFLTLVQRAAAAQPLVSPWPVLDCADAPGHALAALRGGVAAVVLDPDAPGYAAVAAVAAGLGGTLLPRAPPAAGPFAADHRETPAQLAAWLEGRGDSNRDVR